MDVIKAIRWIVRPAAVLGLFGWPLVLAAQPAPATGPSGTASGSPSGPPAGTPPLLASGPASAATSTPRDPAGAGAGDAGAGDAGAGKTEVEIEQEVYREAECEAPLVICLNVDDKDYGEEKDHLPVEVRPGDVVSVKVIGRANRKAIIDATVRKIPQQLMPPDVSAHGAEADNPLTVIEAQAIPVPETAEEIVVRMSVRSTDGPAFVPARTFTLPVSQGRYYARPALLFPLLFQTETIHESTLVGTSDRRISVDTGLRLTPAVTLNVYPFGRDNHRVQSRWHTGDVLVLQAGAGLDFSHPTGFFGLGLEPISGFSVTGGAAFLFDVDRLDAGYEDGMLLPRGAALPTHRDSFVTGYLGLSLSTELVDSLRTLITSTRSQPLP